jgi:hypothetical protein
MPVVASAARWLNFATTTPTTFPRSSPPKGLRKARKSALDAENC